MSVPHQISPLIKTARWGLLVLGVGYGFMHNKTVKKWREEERPIERAAIDKYLKEKADEKEAERIEFEKTSVLFNN